MRLTKLFAAVLAAYACLAQECVPAAANFSYPPLAKTARITGEVTAHVQIKANGFVTVMRLDGHPFLISSLRNEIAELRYPKECGEREVDLRFVFRLAEPEGLPSKTTALGPNHYEVLGFPAIPSTNSDPAPDLIARHGFWRRIFGWW